MNLIMTVAAGIIIAWPSTAALIPAGWIRETTLDARYVQGAAAGADADLASALGAATHTHVSPSHTPTQNAHNHTFSGGASTGTVVPLVDAFDQTVAVHPHTHSSATSGNTTAVNQGVAITVDAASNDLAYVEVIWIKSDGSPEGVPSGAYAFFSSDVLPSSWSRVHGDKYLKGAAASGDGGGTGGANTHVHTSPAHTHTQTGHTHTGTSSNSSAGTFVSAFVSGTSSSAAIHLHTHSVTHSSKVAVNQSVTTTIDASSHEPVFKKLNIIKNDNASANLPDQVIALWGGANSAIPESWARFTDMDGNFPKGANADGESAVSTGGATTHTHTASNCQPIQNAHNHTTLQGNPTVFLTAPDTGTVASLAHVHVWTVNNTTATNNAIAVTISANTAESAYPLYQKVIFIRLTIPPALSIGHFTLYSSKKNLTLNDIDRNVTLYEKGRRYQSDEV